VSAGFRRNPERKDLALVVTQRPAVAAGVFTQNLFCAAPVVVSRRHLEQAALPAGDAASAVAGGAPAFAVSASGAAAAATPPASAGDAPADSSAAPAPGIRAIVLNSGNANAATGEAGMRCALGTARIVAEHLGCEPHQVLVASTGVIGVPLVEAPFVTGIPLALAALGAADGTAAEAGLAAASAIMTTDTHPKQAALTFTAQGTAQGGTAQGTAQGDGSFVLPEGTRSRCGSTKEPSPCAVPSESSRTYTIGGMVKGSGMIQPDMATLLGVLATDAPLTQEAAQRALRRAVDVTFNKVTVDSDTSTNDSVYLLATGAAAGPPVSVDGPLFEPFVLALTALCEDLARQIAADGEGATKLVTVNVTGASDDAQADRAGRAVANSPLVKTAIAGHDANWGRIAMAIGKSGAAFRQQDVGITVMGIPVCEGGLPVPFDEDEALRRFEGRPEVVIDIDLGAGAGSARLWTCDLTHGYVSINGDYRT
jgi:glutamate N-acetyltransferase/amino-acid N-acetyltransferase